jgi:hypothetical protein
MRQPERAEHAFNAGVVQLRRGRTHFSDIASVQLDVVSAAPDRLNQLRREGAPIMAATASRVDGDHLAAASAPRMICAALDCRCRCRLWKSSRLSPPWRFAPHAAIDQRLDGGAAR